MSHTLSTLATSGVAFVPLSGGLEGSTRAVLELPGPMFADQLLNDLGQRVADLAEYVRNARQGRAGTIVLVTGCRRGDGCSTVAWVLARAGAEQGSVLLVDGDLRQPDLSAPIRSQPFSSWIDVFQGRCTIEQILHRVSGQGLNFLPTPQGLPDVEAVLDHPALPLWLARLRQEFGLIVLDGGPVNECGSRWARWVDSVLLVCDPAETAPRGRAEAWDALEAGGAHVLGIIETFV